MLSHVSQSLWLWWGGSTVPCITDHLMNQHTENKNISLIISYSIYSNLPKDPNQIITNQCCQEPTPGRASHCRPKNIPSPALSCRYHRSTSQPEELCQCSYFGCKIHCTSTPLRLWQFGIFLPNVWPLLAFTWHVLLSNQGYSFNLGRHQIVIRFTRADERQALLIKFPNPSYPSKFPKWCWRNVFGGLFLMYKMWLADLGRVPFRSAPCPTGKFCISSFHLPNSQLHEPYSPHTKPAIPNHNFKPRLPITHCQPPQSASPSTSDIAFWPAFQQQQRLLFLPQIVRSFFEPQNSANSPTWIHGKWQNGSVNGQPSIFRRQLAVSFTECFL